MARVMLCFYVMQRLLLVVIAACGSAGPKYTGNTVRVADDRLVAINPDVKTVADADQPVFFARGSYWLFYDGQWYQSSSPSTGWTFAKVVPVPVKQIEQPFAYVHYKHDQKGQEIETVSQRPEPMRPASPNEQPSRERPPTAVDPSVDPTTNL